MFTRFLHVSTGVTAFSDLSLHIGADFCDASHPTVSADSPPPHSSRMPHSVNLLMHNKQRFCLPKQTELKDANLQDKHERRDP